MHITDIMRENSPTFSFEFFPPKTPKAAEMLYQTIRDLESYVPHFVSVTYGAGGSTRDLTHDLVKFIRRFNESGAHPDRRGFGIGVAGFPEGHPATPNRLVEMDYFKAKVDAGANYIVTQLFFDNRDFIDFRERCTLNDIHVPIIAGIMPITSISGCKRIAELAGGARFPAKLMRALQSCQNDPEMVRRVGVQYALEQCHDLLDNDVAGIHFYTLNRSDATRIIFDSLGFPHHRNARALSV